MTNITNLQLNNNNNVISAKKISNNASDQKRNIGVLEAPDYIPKYSIHKTLQEKDEFRKSLLYQNYSNTQKSKKRKSLLIKLGIIASAIAGYFILKRKV